ncbi:hypothetical protein [Flavilitoribacter nigricans]|uniref:Uncharacterized protein n=1 Tax=Flavilitoribacter nigricans (strain ATCC 23147 / DSM 23189 / NBRC 102662 / NCIMB 1420 / SS-2) TaxID=1122177 RepID=A0A2D0N346_FLAN2|nr:hypothetical protein [Flavilitoribacter nigricans]PHN02830.1 hypothetical protein CRP01_30075 [Flavilitoribacter nigricans DSM 23189 = NBRC 102662]
MVKFLLFFAGLLVLGFIFQLFLPWWIITPIAAILAWLLRLNPRQAFTASLIAGLLLWGGYAIYLDNGILSNRLGAMMGGLPSALIFVLTSLVGGLLAAMGGVTGSLGREIMPASSGEKV